MKKHSAFTLIELMMTIAVFAILATLAAPSFSSFMLSNAMTTNTNKLLSSFHLARSEAITRGTRVSVCASDDAMSTATPSCSGSGKWENGWFVWQDTDNNNAVSAGETIIQVIDKANGSAVTIRASGEAANTASFIATGLPQNSAGLNYSDTLRICDSRGITNGAARSVQILASGRIRATTNGTCP